MMLMAQAVLPTRAELLAALSVAIDLGLGQPAEHMLRAALIATRLCDRLGLSRQQRDCVYYTTLVMWIGCHADSHEYARWFGDDIAVRHDSYLVDWSGIPYLRFLASNVGRGQPLAHRLSVMATLFANARGHISRLIHSHCASAALLADRIGLGPNVQAALAYTFERYDGGGLPTGARGEDIPIQMRIAQLADMVEVHHRSYGVAGAVAMVGARRGGQFDPGIADVFLRDADAILAGPQTGDAWAAALREAPDRHRVDEQSLDAALVALGDFVDLKCPFTLGHSRAVARLAGQAARAAGLDADAVALTRRAGHVHDLGRIGVSNQIWSRPGPLSGSQFERVRLHPYLTVRILDQVPGLRRLAEVAGNHHECLDGSGYPRGLAGPALGMPDRILAAAVCYQSGREPRPYREQLSEAEAARRLRGRVRCGELDPVAAEAVLHAAGQPVGPRPNPRPDGLTPMEIEVLGHVARGASNKEIAAALVISEKTARNHVERTYAKIGVSNRIGASMYALQHGLVPAAPLHS